MSKISDDPRIDARIKAVMGVMPEMRAGDGESREQLLADSIGQFCRGA